MIERIEAGQCWQVPGYHMQVTAVRNGFVIWDGNYDTGYETPIERFETFLRDGDCRWKCNGEQYKGSEPPAD